MFLSDYLYRIETLDKICYILLNEKKECLGKTENHIPGNKRSRRFKRKPGLGQKAVSRYHPFGRQPNCDENGKLKQKKRALLSLSPYIIEVAYV